MSLQGTITYDDVTVKNCVKCQFMHQFPVPTQEELDAYYAEDKFYTTFSPNGWLDKEFKEHSQGLWDTYYEYKLSLLGLYKPNQTLLDVGCGAGWFVQYASNHQVNAIGYEPSWSARDITRNPLIKSVRPEQQFDAIHMALVLEHVADPFDFVAKWTNQLRHSGRMCIVVPHDFSPLQDELETYHFISKVHINYFQPEGLRHVMNMAGLRVIHESATFPMELFQISRLLPYIGNDKNGLKAHMLRLRFEKLFGVRAFRLYEKLYKKWGWGRELVFVGERV